MTDESVDMETIGILGMIFGIAAFAQLQGVSKELAELKKSLKESGALEADEKDAGV